MICCCEKCRFVFESAAQLSQCPDCGFGPVRTATGKESLEYAANRRLYGSMRVYGVKRLPVMNGKGHMVPARHAVTASF